MTIPKQWIYGAGALAIVACSVFAVGAPGYVFVAVIAAGPLALAGMIAYEFVSAKREHRITRWRIPSRAEVAFLGVVATIIGLGAIYHWWA